MAKRNELDAPVCQTIEQIISDIGCNSYDLLDPEIDVIIDLLVLYN